MGGLAMCLPGRKAAVAEDQESLGEGEVNAVTSGCFLVVAWGTLSSGFSLSPV